MQCHRTMCFAIKILASENYLITLFFIVADYCYYRCDCILSRQGWKFPEQFQRWLGPLLVKAPHTILLLHR
jgi:hypothetical protein